MSLTTRQILQGAAACVIAFAVLMSLAYYSERANWLDSAALHGFVSIYRPGIDSLATGLAHFCNPLRAALVPTPVIALAGRTRGLRTAAAVGFLLAEANVSSQVLKPLLAHHREL